MTDVQRPSEARPPLTAPDPLVEARYRIANDESGHDYAIPVQRAAEWNAWLNGPEWEAGEVPDYAIRIDGRFTFTDPRNS